MTTSTNSLRTSGSEPSPGSAEHVPNGKRPHFQRIPRETLLLEKRLRLQALRRLVDEPCIEAHLRHQDSLLDFVDRDEVDFVLALLEQSVDFRVR